MTENYSGNYKYCKMVLDIRKGIIGVDFQEMLKKKQVYNKQNLSYYIKVAFKYSK